MTTVEPIRDRKKLEAMKKFLKAQSLPRLVTFRFRNKLRPKDL